jgi:CubicO group peptidase (beta-lactamase class C family)
VIRRLAVTLLFLVAMPMCKGDDLPARLDAIATSTFKANEPGAAILVVKDGKTVLRKGYGLADAELNVAITPDNIFRIGSVTKQFTAVAILQLVQQGKIALEDDITKHLPDAPTAGKKITIENLLTHTSGIPSYTDQPSFPKRAREDMSPAEMLAMAKGVAPDFDPSANWHYNNSGYILLGMLIEKVSGQKYADYMREHIFVPAGMKDTAYDQTEKIVPRRAHGYSQAREGFVNAPYLSMTLPFAAGGLLSTVDDLVRWTDALQGGKLVDPKLLTRAHTPFQLTSGASTRYGFGWGISEFEGHHVVEHGGGIHGFLSYLLTMPDDKLVVVVLANANRQPTPQYVAYRLAGEVLGKPFPPKTIALTPEIGSRYVGSYRLDEQRVARIESFGNKLMLYRPDAPPMEMLPLSPTEFAVKDSITRVSFQGDKITIAFVGPIETGTRIKVP